MNEEKMKDNTSPALPLEKTNLISFIVAADENNLIGKNNELPWHLPSDMKYFKNQTWGMTVIMGRKSLDSLGKPLPGRKNIVITRNRDWQHEGVLVAHSVEESVELAKHTGAREVFIIGGAEIFKTALPIADRIYLTRIHHRFEGDAYFPEIPSSEWSLVKDHFCDADEKNKYQHSFQVWERK